MEDASPSSSLENKGKECTDRSNTDKMPTINEDETLHKVPEDAKVTSESKKKVEMVAESPAKTMASPFSPFRSPSAASTTMTSAKWIQTVISPLPSVPSAELKEFLSKCDKDVTHDVIHRARIILEAIFLTTGAGECTGVNGSLMDNVWAEQRRLEAVKLYYKVLHAMCRAEAQILSGGNLTSLLTNERFHRCMLACSAELVLATHKTVTTLFPAVLERTGITSFDLCKVIESFIRHEDSLPRELRRHLNSLEERLLESLVWEKGSSMYNSLTVARPSLSSEIIRMELLSEPMPSLDAIAMHINISSAALPPPPPPPPPPPLSPFQKREISPPGQNGDIRSPKRHCPEYRSVLVERNSFTSPVKDRLLAFTNLKSKLPPPALQSAFASPTKPSPGNGGETCAETAINVFFCKTVKLAAVRINGMVDRLQLSQDIRETVYRLFKQILSQRTFIFFNRHIDQIILCCFYGVAKVSRLNLTFKEIICNYRKQPHCKPHVFRNVFVDRSSTRQNGQKSWQDNVDIITFYNEVFIPSVKILLGDSSLVQRTSQGSDVKNGECPVSPRVSSFPSIPDMSPKKVSAAHNIYVSPLRSSKMDALISHSSKSYYACLGESTHAFQSPSKDLTAINDHLNGGGSGGGSNKKFRGGTLKFEEVGGLISDSVVANSLYLQNGDGSAASAPPLKLEQPDA